MELQRQKEIQQAKQKQLEEQLTQLYLRKKVKRVSIENSEDEFDSDNITSSKKQQILQQAAKRASQLNSTNLVSQEISE